MAIDKKCPKCGHNDVHMQFYAVGDKITGKDVRTCKEYIRDIKDIGMESFARGFVDQECVKVHCRTCQYAWCKLPADNIEEPSNAFGMSSEDIERCRKELGDDIKEALKEMGVVTTQPYVYSEKDFYTGDSPDWYNSNRGTCFFDGWDK